MRALPAAFLAAVCPAAVAAAQAPAAPAPAAEAVTPFLPPSGTAPLTNRPTVAGVRDAVSTLYRDTGVPEGLTRSLEGKEGIARARQVAPAQIPARPAPAPAAPPAPTPDQASALDLVAPKADGAVGRAGCTTCGGFHSQSDGLAFHSAIGGCSDGQCVPGREKCDALIPPCDTFAGAFVSNLYQSLCCPDPCYQPSWVPAANASLFADYAKPRTVTRFRYDLMQNVVFPNRNEYLLKQTNPNIPFKNRTFRTDPSTRIQVLYMYQEAATAAGSLFVEYPYLQLNPRFSPTQAGFGDIRFGTKSVLYDVEMLRVSFQFKTYTPSGNSMKGLGTGHVSLEPSILTSLKLTPETYLQGQFGQWIPLGGTQGLTGGVLFWFMSLNQVLTYVTPSSPLIGMIEMDGWSFESGGYTNPYKAGPGRIASGGGVSYFNVGPGLRLSICDKLDLGGTVTWATTSKHWGDPWFRFEVRFLF